MKTKLQPRNTKTPIPPNRVLRISVASKKSSLMNEYADSIENSHHLLDVDHRIKLIPRKSSYGKKTEDACASDVLVTDDTRLAEIVHDCRPDMRIIGVSNSREEELRCIEQERKKVLNGFYLRNVEQPRKLGEIVRKNAFKKVNVGIIGRGRSGARFAQRFFESDITESVATWSETLDRGEINLNLILEKLPGPHSKYSEPENLEDLIEKSDVLLICSSHLRGHEIVRLTEKDPTRSAVFPYEADKFYNYFRTIAEHQTSLEDKKPILIYSNPPGPLMLLAERLGIDRSRLTSGSFSNNVRRFYEVILNVMFREGTLRKEDFDRAVEHAARNVVGIHGVPFYCGDKSGFPEVITDEIIKEAEERACRAGKLSQETGQKLEVTSEMPQISVFDFVNQIARYEQPLTNDYTYVEFTHNRKKYSGFGAVPLRNFYNSSYPRFSFNLRGMHTLDKEKFFSRMAVLLKDQQERVDEFLKIKESRTTR